MKKGQYFWQNLADSADLTGETLPGQWVAELLGGTRVLVENHRGVKEYSRETIAVSLSSGLLRVMGQDLELVQMTKEQLVIGGTIHKITLVREEKV